jgi:hypothetical protein
VSERLAAAPLAQLKGKYYPSAQPLARSGIFYGRPLIRSSFFCENRNPGLDDIPAVGVSISALYCPCWSYFMTQRHLEREKAATGACGFLNDVLCAPLCLGGSFIVGEAVLAGLMQIFSCIFCIVSIF